MMKKYDVVLIGGGSGTTIAQQTLMHGASVAIINKPPIGGTCENFGCIPSKMLIYPADIIANLYEAKKLGIDAEVRNVDFKSIMNRMRKKRKDSQDHQKKALDQVENFKYYLGEGFFIDDYTMQVNDEKIKGEKIFIGSGARPLIPPIKGIDKVDYLTNESLLELTDKPKSLIIIGGGYIAAEYGHFFSAMGTKITILQRSKKLVPNEEPDISDLLKKELGKRMDIFTNTEAVEVKESSDMINVIGKNVDSEKEKIFVAEKILVAAGRKSNADLLKVENTGVETDERGYIKANEYLETSKKNIWAFGDVIGKQMFKHVANEESYIAWNNAFHEQKLKMDYNAVPHAVFSHPQIASVGLTQNQAEKEGFDLLVGKAKYNDVAKGDAMMEAEGFAKAIVDKKTMKILGFHMLGPYAPMIIQEVITIMAIGGQVGHIGQGMHIHPALPELIPRTLSNLKEV
jgi:dihydrolipoamide dehydrogenase